MRVTIPLARDASRQALAGLAADLAFCHPDIERIAADASDAERLSALAEGAVAIYNCVNPLYHRWLTDWPPIAAALRTAAERSGA